MENIRQAVERARGLGAAESESRAPGYTMQRLVSQSVPARQFSLDSEHLTSKRIVCQDSEDPRSKSFDMLRTQVLRSMDLKDWKTVAVTAPTAGCGKTVISVNLALSVARQSERSVLLVDLDLRKAEVAECLGIPSKDGVIDVLDERVALADAVVQVHIGEQNLLVLPTSKINARSSERMASQALSTMLLDIRRDYPSRIVIIDMPPMLTGDDVLTVLPQFDCFLLVAAVGVSSVAEISECKRQLQSADVVRWVLNKAPDAAAHYVPKYAS